MARVTEDRAGEPAHIDEAETVLRGTAIRDPDLAVRHIHPDRYVEHDPAVADGVAAQRDFVRGLPDGVRLDVVRAFGDGAFAVVQTQGALGGHTVFFDVFRFEEGWIVEHWRFSSEGGPPNRSGHAQASGPTEPRDLQYTEANKALVRGYFEAVHLGGRHEQVRRYMRSEVQIRHEPGVEDGVTAFERDLVVISRDRTIDAIRLLLGCGDVVFIAAVGTHAGAPCAYVDLYRVERGALVEHWGFPQPIPSPERAANRNGLL